MQKSELRYGTVFDGWCWRKYFNIHILWLPWDLDGVQTDDEQVSQSCPLHFQVVDKVCMWGRGRISVMDPFRSQW